MTHVLCLECRRVIALVPAVTIRADTVSLVGALCADVAMIRDRCPTVSSSADTSRQRVEITSQVEI